MQASRGRIQVERYEKIWIVVSLSTLVLFLLAVAVAAIGGGIHLPGAAGRVEMGGQHGDRQGAPANFAQPGLETLK